MYRAILRHSTSAQYPHTNIRCEAQMTGGSPGTAFYITGGTLPPARAELIKPAYTTARSEPAEQLLRASTDEDAQ